MATLAFCVLFTVATVTVRTWFAWSNNLATMNAELNLIDQVFQGTLSKAVWEMDSEALQAQIDSVALAAPSAAWNCASFARAVQPRCWSVSIRGIPARFSPRHCIAS